MKKMKTTKITKITKTIVSLLLTMVMAFVMTEAVIVYADPTTFSVTIYNSTDGHTYEAYQIFAGDLSVDSSGTRILSNIVWGSGISEAGKTALGNATAKAETLRTESDARDFAREVEYYLDTPAGSTNEVINGDYYEISGLSAGYYLIKDMDDSLTDANDVYTEYIIKVVSDTTANPKSDVPTVEKKLKDINDSIDDNMTEWQDCADYDIGDSVPFQLTAVLADNVSSYTTYKVVFHDTLSNGLTYNRDAKVCIGGTETNGFTVTSAAKADGTTVLTVSCDNVKALGVANSAVITVNYTAELNSSAAFGMDGNPNHVVLEYSNNPNKSDMRDNETGRTPEDTVIVFTYKAIINKITRNPDYNAFVEGSQEYISLTGAEFTLEKYNKKTNSWGAITGVKNGEGTTFTFAGLDDGNYRLTETQTPEGYNSIEPIAFTVTAEHEILSDSPVLTNLNGNTTTGTLTFTPDIPGGSLAADIVNQSGAVLPETGGMGTTLIYITGTLLVVGAAVLLVVRRRMSAEE